MKTGPMTSMVPWVCSTPCALIRVPPGSAILLCSPCVCARGTWNLLPRPLIELDWASVVSGTERVQVDSSGPLVQGTKEFDWILTPRREGRVIVPPFRYSYFDPYKGEYAVATTSGSEIGIRAGALVSVEEDDATAPPALRPDQSTTAPNVVVGSDTPSAWGWWSIVLALLVPVPVVVTGSSSQSGTSVCTR